MKAFRLSPTAEEDLDDLWSYIARDSLDAADRVVQELYDAIVALTEMPFMGHYREELPDRSFRVWRVRSNLIIYHPETQPLEIVRIVSGYRDIAALFDTE